MSALIFFLMICLGVGLLGSVFTASSVKTWYRTLRKPSWTPPDKLFAPVWTILYVLMAVAAWKVWIRLGTLFSKEMLVFAIQLFLNSIWSWFFFALKKPLWALVEIIVLWIAILLNCYLFLKVEFSAGMLFVPYLLWVSYAMALNFSIHSLNTPQK